jgi:methionine-rich copper-binding protein CopC
MMTTCLRRFAVLVLASALAPGAGSNLASAPKEIRLQFSDNVELPFSKIKLLNANDAPIEASAIALDKGNPRALVATLPALTSGVYRVRWSTVTRDGHKVKGEYSFTIK